MQYLLHSRLRSRSTWAGRCTMPGNRAPFHTRTPRRSSRHARSRLRFSEPLLLASTDRQKTKARPQRGAQGRRPLGSRGGGCVRVAAAARHVAGFAFLSKAGIVAHRSFTSATGSPVYEHLNDSPRNCFENRVYLSRCHVCCGGRHGSRHVRRLRFGQPAAHPHEPLNGQSGAQRLLFGAFAFWGDFAYITWTWLRHRRILF